MLLFLPLIFFWAIWTVELSETDHEDINLGEGDTPEGGTVPKTGGDQEQPARRPQLRTWTDTVAMFNGATGTRSSVTRWSVFVVVCAIFGSLHFLAWSMEMPTHAERLIWRFSAIYLTALPFVLVAAVAPFLDTDLEESHLGLAYCMLIVVIAAAHPLIRAIVVVDALALLRQLPDTAYRELEWSDVIPSL